MVVAVEGVLVQKEPTFVVLKTSGGLSYGISISLFCAANLEKGQKVELYTSMIIKEDSQRLFGFLDKNEQKMFEMLLKVNGVGAATAMAVCSSLDVNSFYKALQMGDENAFKKVPGIGAKSAKRILIELGNAKMAFDGGNLVQNEAFQALLSLGFKQDKILKALSECKATNTADLIKEALQKIS